jgi:hypothetical protein
MEKLPPLGLVAGEGIFPLLVARGARAAGRSVACVGFKGNAWPQLADEVDHFAWAGPSRPASWLRFLHRHGCQQAIMVGRVQKVVLHHPLRMLTMLPDWLAIRLWWTILRKDKSSQTILSTMSNLFATENVPLIDSTSYCKEHLATAGVMTRRQPTPNQWEDIHFGWERCVTISRLDIGQAIALLNRDVIAVEAAEGTNAMIERAAGLCRAGNWVCIKVSNTHQDMRLDVPTVGVTTIEKLHAAKASCLVLEPDKTIMLEKPKVIELADRFGICIVGYEPAAGKA